MTEECRVVKKGKRGAVIEITRRPECDGCKACAFNRRNSIKMTAKSEVDCAVGDRVVVEMPNKTIVGSSLVLFALPIILVLAAVLITAKMAWYVQVSSICGALLIGFAAVVLCDRLIMSNSAYLPIIKSVIKENNTINKGETHD